MQVRAEVEDVKRENQQQKEDLLQTIRENDTQLKLMNFILDNFVPEEERLKIEDHCSWDDESCDWVVAHQHLTGLTPPTSPSIPFHALPPPSYTLQSWLTRNVGVLSRCPTGTVVRREQLMPSTHGRPVNSRKSPMFGENTEEDDFMGMAIPSIPNVYFSYPSSSGGPIEHAVENERPQSGRPKSRTRTASAKRPTSARKGSRKDESAVKSQFLSFDEAHQMVSLSSLPPPGSLSLSVWGIHLPIAAPRSHLRAHAPTHMPRW